MWSTTLVPFSSRRAACLSIRAPLVGVRQRRLGCANGYPSPVNLNNASWADQSLERRASYNVSFRALAFLQGLIDTGAGCTQCHHTHWPLSSPVTVLLRGRAGARCMVSFLSRLTRPTHDRKTTSSPKPVRSTAARYVIELRRGVPVRSRV